MMDLSKLDVRAAAEVARDMVLRHPGTGQAMDTVFEVLGYDHDSVVEAGRAFDRAAMKSGKMPDALDRKIALAKVALVGWRGMVWEGADKPFAHAFSADLLSRPGFSWMVDQIHAFGGNRANLFPEPPKD